VEYLVGDRELVPNGKRYYVGTVREKVGDEESREAMARQLRLFSKLKEAGWHIKTSKLRERIEKIVIDERVSDYQKILDVGIHEIVRRTFREKGIDERIG
jgi:uncharacterized protein YueI